MRRTFTNIPLYLVVFVNLAVGALMFSGCSAEEDKPAPSSAAVSESKQSPVRNSFKSVSGAEAQTMINQKENLLVIDVRTPQERAQVRLSGSELIPIGDVMRGRLVVPKEQPILVVCAVGGRSYIASKALLAMGHQEVYNLDGGIEAWRRAQLPVETGPEDRKKK